MVNIEGAIAHVKENIQKLEESMYDFETVTMPRVEKDREILAKMREDVIKMKALKEKKDKGKEIPAAELESIPRAFR